MGCQGHVFMSRGLRRVARSSGLAIVWKRGREELGHCVMHARSEAAPASEWRFCVTRRGRTACVVEERALITPNKTPEELRAGSDI